MREMILSTGISNNEEAIKALEEYYFDPRCLETASVAVYQLAYCFASALNDNVRDEIVSISAEGMVMDLPKLVADSDSARAFCAWCCYRLKAIISNKAKDHYRQETAHLRKCVSGDSVIPESENITLFSMLKGPDDNYFEDEKEKDYRKRQLLFFRRTAEIVANECPTYTLGYWSLLGSAFARKLDIPTLFLEGKLSSFSYILQRIGVRKVCIVMLMDALVHSQARFVRNEKTGEQSRKRVSDYRTKAKKVLRTHTELLQYFAVK